MSQKTAPELKFLGKRAARISTEPEEIVTLLLVEALNQNRQFSWRGQIAELCRRGGLNQNLYYRWSKDFLEAGKKRLAGDTSNEVKDLRRESSALKEVVAELTLENPLIKESVTVRPMTSDDLMRKGDSIWWIRLYRTTYRPGATRNGWRVRVAGRRPDLAFDLQSLGEPPQVELVQVARHPHPIVDVS